MCKRIIVFVLSLLLLGLVGCGNDPLPIQTTAPTTETPSTAATTLPTETTLPEETEPLFSAELVTVTDKIPEYDHGLEETFLIPHEQQNASVYTSLYVHLARGGEFNLQDNAFLVSTEKQLMNSGNRYEAYTVEDGEIKKLQSSGFYREYEFNGARYIIDFSYALHNGHVIYTYIKNSGDPNFVERGKDLGDNRLLLMLNESTGQGLTFKRHPVVLDMTTGGITDYLQGLTDAQVSLLIDGYEFTQLANYTVLDENRFLVHKGLEELYYVDKEQGVVEALHTLVGGAVFETSVAEESLICWTLESPYPPYSSDIWKINLKDFSTKKLLEKVPVYPQAASFVFYAVGDSMYYYDFLKESGGFIEVPEEWYFKNYHISPDGRKAFFIKTPNPNYPNAPQEDVMVFDSNTMKFTHIVRENQNPIDDLICGWTEDGKIYVVTEGQRDFYVYDLK